MKTLIDTNILLDIALERQPFVAHAAMVLKTGQHTQIQLFITATLQVLNPESFLQMVHQTG